MHELASRRSPPIGFAHRGAKAHARENTIDAFELALRLGATGLESDVWITRDGQAVLDHDGVVRRMLFRTPIAEIDYADLPGHIPTLEHLYEACGSDFELSLDVKTDDAFAETVRVAKACGAESRLWLCHHDWRVLRTWRNETDCKLVDSTRLSRMKPGPERHAADIAEVGVDAVNMHRKDWTGGLAVLFHRFELDCFGWDAQHERTLIELVEMGLDGVYSDHVDKMMDVLAGPDSTGPKGSEPTDAGDGPDQ